jgi:pimeloyl-ACP methyl ester carboxylesterase
MSFSERALIMGKNPQLVGVLSETNKKNKRPIILLTNAGLLGHVGPFRLYVLMARHFASLGFTTLRFDLSGIGDSERQLSSKKEDEQAIHDIRFVMDHLDHHEGGKEYIIMGICMGADHAHRTMLHDPRVMGAVCMDGYSFPTPRYYYHFYKNKLFHWSSWFSLAKKIMNFILIRSKKKEKIDLDYHWIEPSKEKIADDYRFFIQKKVHLLSIFTASWSYNYLEQQADSFKNIHFEPYIQIAYLENAEHLYPLVEDKKQLMATIEEWLKKSFVV